MQHTIRKMKKEDIPKVHSLGISQDAFKTDSGVFWTFEQLENWVESAMDVLLVAECENKIIGFTFFGGHIPTKKVTWENLYIIPEYRKNGVAKDLITEGLKQIKSLGYVYVIGCVNADDQGQFVKYVEKFDFKDGGQTTWIDRVL